ncbi:N-acetyl-alpha-D-glucosaminyl L-malate synthase [Nymphaea thermarum]|nr:N-acetyl-alpha-D-glucosaminyl L-malate synthase [Nymphaea thermarum]KAF3786051.1 N-acetyl-alpha-D-glucosaminyl L-malate synthase [Nymphaea thermarum]
MEESDSRGDSQGNGTKPAPLKTNSSFKATASGRLTPKNAASFRRSRSIRTPRKEPKLHISPLRWIRSKRLFPWLVIIGVWSYIGFHIQSKWTHDEHKKEFLGYESKPLSQHQMDGMINSTVPKEVDTTMFQNGTFTSVSLSEALADGGRSTGGPNGITVSASKTKKSSSRRRLSRKKTKTNNNPQKRNGTMSEISNLDEETEPSNGSITPYETIKGNTSYGLIVGPFSKMEDSILEWSPEKRTSTCDRKRMFAQTVWGRSFVLIIHELSLTGAPVSMMQLASELLSCGGTVSAVVLSKKGELMGELSRRGIKVLKDKADLSYKAASKADLVIAGSAVCASWIEQYLSHYMSGGSQVVWWIMENRRPYFDHSKHVLSKVKMLMFLSENQSEQWVAWCKEEKIPLRSSPELVPLSIADELAYVAGLPSSLNTPSFTIEKMLEKRHLLRDAVRREIGLNDSDMLVMTLSSINPGKGQLFLLESAFQVSNKLSFQADIRQKLATQMKNSSIVAGRKHRRAMAKRKTSRALLNDLSHPDYENMQDSAKNRQIRRILSEHKGKHREAIKVLIGSLGCKSNKVIYVNAILRFLSEHSDLSKVVLWTPATTRVASLYAAADVYVINSQGVGETFGRVTIEAMAFGLPVLGTDAGGSRQLIEHNVTGLLHPLGQDGVQALADNLEFLLHNPSVREAMGAKGRNKVMNSFLKNHMYQRLAIAFRRSMKVK